MVASQVTILPYKYYYIISGSSSLNFRDLRGHEPGKSPHRNSGCIAPAGN